ARVTAPSNKSCGPRKLAHNRPTQQPRCRPAECLRPPSEDAARARAGALELSGGMEMRGSWTKAIQGWGAAALLVLSALPAAAQTQAGGGAGRGADAAGGGPPR